MAQIGLEIWDKTSGTSVIVGSTGSQSGDKTINVASNDSLLLKQPKDTTLDASARVDIYTGWYGKAGTYVNTVFANSAGYWEYAITANTNDCRRYFVYVNNTTYSNGISVQIGSAKCGGNGGGCTNPKYKCSSGSCISDNCDGSGTLPTGCNSSCTTTKKDCEEGNIKIGTSCYPTIYIIGGLFLFMFMMSSGDSSGRRR